MQKLKPVRKKRNVLQKFSIMAIVMGVFIPFIPIVVWSFSFRWAYPSLTPTLGMRAWNYVFSQRNILTALGTSVLLSSTVTLVAFLIGLPASRALGMYRFKGRRFAEMILTLPAIVPSLAVIMGLQVIFIQLGLINTFFGVVLVHLIPTLPYMIMYLTSTFEDYQKAYEDQAQVLGANFFVRIVRINIPIIFPGIVVAALQSFLVTWTQYLLTVMIGGPNVKTLPTVLFSFLGSGDFATSSAVSLVFILPALLLLTLSSRFLSGSNKDVTMGGANKI